MPLWLVVFMIVWTTITLFISVLLGAYIGYCKEQKLNPVKHMSTGFLDAVKGTRDKEEDVRGFYQ